MIISHYGKKFLKKYNEINNKSLSAKDFCIDIMFPLFFQKKYLMMSFLNTPFSQPAYSKKTYDEKIKIFYEDIKKGKVDASILLGGYVNSFVGETSFNIPTQYNNTINEDEIYLSWIGQGLAIKMGGIDFLFDNEQILYDVYLGWHRYSELLNSDLYVDFKDKQIQTWNSNWLLNKYSTFPQNNFNPLSECDPKRGLNSISWIRLVFALSNKYPNTTLNSYVFKLGKMNETYGIITFELKKIGGFLNFCKEYFGENLYLQRPQLFENLFGNSYGFEKICSEFGIFGFEAIKPELFKLEQYVFKSDKIKKKINKQYTALAKDEINYKLLNLYLMAKINLKDSGDLIIGVAKTLNEINEKSRKNNQKFVDDFLESRNQTKFLERINALNDICGADGLKEQADALNDFNLVVIENSDKLADLMLLIKFNYNRIKYFK